MPHNNFHDLDNLSAYIAFFAGFWGAALNFMKRDTQEMSFIKKFYYFLMDMFVSMGLSMLAFIGLIGYGVNDLTAVAVSGFIAHLGTRSFHLVEMIIAEKLGAKSVLEEIKGEKRNG